ncbi:KIAA1033 [Cordylochernes scorpioides]|uniref:KIAA1033 n=1 Tax=Cordylochernes scorpioides TaxID=51811 RepID=A0ABY6LJ75_9ARAC|nr:KIAA1033 [Cordylochernes scorpioides]
MVCKSVEINGPFRFSRNVDIILFAYFNYVQIAPKLEYEHDQKVSAIVENQFQPHERTTLLELVSTDNKILNKVVTVLAALCTEIQELCQLARNRFFPALLFYGESEPAQDGLQEGEVYLYIGRMTHLMQDLSIFVTRSYAVVKNVVHQLSSLYSRTQPTINMADVHLETVFRYLGDLLTVLVTLDEIVDSQTALREHWTLYRRMVKSIHHNPSKFGLTTDQLLPLEKVLARLESQLLEGRIFQGCVDQQFDDEDAYVSKNSFFAEEFGLNIRNHFASIELKLGEGNEFNSRTRLVGIAALYVLDYHLFRTAEKKFFKSLWDTYKKVPAVPLVGNLLFFMDQFLLMQLPHVARTVDRKAQEAVKLHRLNFLSQRSQTLARDVQTIYLQVSAWMVKMDSDLYDTGRDDISRKCSLFIQGLKMAWAISHQLRTIMNLHAVLSKPMVKSAVLSCCRLVEILKAIEGTFYRQSIQVAQSLNLMIQYLGYGCLKNIAVAKKRLVTDKKYNERRLDVLSALVLAEKALNGPGTKERRLIVHLAMSIGIQLKSFQAEELAGFYSKLAKYDAICEINENIKEACDCSFFYWHRVVIPIYFSDLFDNALDCSRVHYLLAGMQDCVAPLLETCHDSGPQVLVSALEKELYGYFKEKVLEPLCRDVETDLRLHSHLHLQLDDRNPFKVGLKNLAALLELQPLRFFDRFVSVKTYVEHYLDETFYNLTTVALHDWKTYGEMRSLARHKYGLETVEAHLPSQTLDQGLDVLEIMRNIDVFVAKYLYNLNNQIFVEKSSNNKHLNTINIRHIANSIRTHGIGIMGTIVNYTYQYLRKKFYRFSQFLYDEQIKSRLIKDIKYFRENKAQLDQKYPFDRAEKFNKGIRKLGLSEDNQSCLDHFRQLISQIGNALGYVRMIRSGGLHCCSNAIRYIPDLEDIVCFEELAREEALSDDCVNAAAKLDSTISTLSKNFAEGSDYFKLLVEVFSSAFQDPKHIHLKNFYIILPPLTLNFVEHSISCKERMSKKNKTGAAFTDDGFAMGVAYILKLLDQYQEFDSLHWFQSVRDKCLNDKAGANTERRNTGPKEDAKLDQMLNLTTRRLEDFQREFDLLNYSLSSARIFFRADLTAAEEKAAKKGSEVPPTSE